MTRIFYGWWVVAAAFTVCFVGFGNAYTFSAFLGSLQHDFGATRASVSLVFSIAGFLYFGLGVLSGPLADRIGARPLALVGMVLVGLGLIAASFAQALWQVYVAYGVGIGFGVGAAYVPSLGAVQRWFVARRGFASGLAVAGIGVGTLVMPPLATWLIGREGWRSAYLILGVLAIILGVGLSLFIVDHPKERGLHADGLALSAENPIHGHELADALRSRTFVTLYLACLVSSFGLFVPFVHLIPYAVDHGVPAGAASLLLGLIGVGSTVGRFFLGGLADKVGRVNALLLMFLGMGLSLSIWAYSTAFWGLSVFAVAYGFFQGGYVAIAPALVADLFGGKNVSGIMGALFTSVAFGTLVGPTLAGYAYDVSHSYLLPILGAMGLNFIAARILAGLSRSLRRQLPQGS
jgi:OFA family oxalate/formate antiporter-like MFS transporter